MDGRMMVARLPPLAGARGITPRGDQKFEGLTGPTYKLNDKTHPLPNPRSLRPYVDTKSGEVDTWPAHASGHAVPSTTLMLSKNKSLVLYDEESTGKPNMIPKPRFLDQLEGYLKKELRALGVKEVCANDLRLQQMLVTVSEQCDQKIMAIREEEKQEMKDLREENKRLLEKIQSMNNEKLDLEAQVDKLHDELKEQFERYKDELDQKKILLQEITDMRDQKDDLLASKEGDTGEPQDDPLSLSCPPYRQAREDEKNATKRLNDMITNYYDVIPRRDFETLEAKYNTLLESSETTKDDFMKLKAEHDALLDVQKQVTKQRDEFYMELEGMKRTATPRPDWERCSDFVTGGATRWAELSQGKSSNDLVDVLLGEIAAGGPGDVGGAEYFDGQGTGPTVPKYLRYEGPVRNRRLGKRDCSLLVRDIWREKAAHDASKQDGVRDVMGDFLDEYLHRRFAMEQMRVEWGYNLHDACQRYSHDESIGQFWGVLEGNVDEEVYHSQMAKIELLMNELTKIDVDKGNPGTITKAELRNGIQTIFPAISEESLEAMMKAGEVELDNKESDEVDYKEVFKEDDEGKTGPFLDEVREYMKQEKIKYTEEIKQQLDSNPVSVDDLKRAIMVADPDLDMKDLVSYLSWAFRYQGG
ncbi:hypothetical protein FSP39_011055 [Pinctada imbricata]|uniref:Uncharacterized protein n=1 Tax=Pinctada imbricata TaxID=66713 RepID=A0AA88XHV6_PINIB|nr:hypothetical protein FSP39_011055 [Pinctada imbricata]